MANPLSSLNPLSMITAPDMLVRPTLSRLKITSLLLDPSDKRNFTMYAQFNPNEFTITKEASWDAASKSEGKKKPPKLNAPCSDFGGGKPATFSLTLYFDTTQETSSSERDVRKYTNKLFLLTLYDKSSKVFPDPPTVRVSWGPIILFKAVVKKVAVQFTMFYADGTPARAKADVDFEQHERADDMPGTTNPTSRTEARRTHVVQLGERLDNIAQVEYGHPAHWRHIAQANGLLDPFDLRPGQVLALPPLPTEL